MKKLKMMSVLYVFKAHQIKRLEQYCTAFKKGKLLRLLLLEYSLGSTLGSKGKVN